MADSTRVNLTNLMGSLMVSPEKEEIINEMNVIISAVNPNQLSDLVRNIQLSPIFNWLSETNSNYILSGVELLNKLLSSVPPKILISEFSEQLIIGLKHSVPDVREVILKQLEHAAKDNTTLMDIASNKELLCNVTQLLGDSSMSVAKYSSAILTLLGQDSDAVDTLLSTPIKDILNEVASKEDIMRFRVYEVIVNLACISTENLKKTVNSSFMQSLVGEIHKDDVLVMLNSVELMIQLALSDHGLQYLVQQGVLTRLQGMLIQSAENPLFSFVLPGLVKFFGNIGYTRPKKLWNEYPEVINMFFEFLEDNDTVLKGVAIETIGVLGSRAEGKRMLEVQETKMMRCLTIMGQEIFAGVPSVRVRALPALSSLLDIKREEYSINLETLSEKWYRMLGPDPTDKMLALCRQPFTDIRCSALHVVKVLASQIWGQKELASFPGFLEYILDRSTESDKIGKEAKYAVIQELVDSPSTGSIFDSGAILKLREYYTEGPFFVRAQAEVAFEAT